MTRLKQYKEKAIVREGGRKLLKVLGLIGMLAASIASADTGSVQSEEKPDSRPQGLEDRTGWYQGRVEPVLEQEALQQDSINVIVYLIGNEVNDQVEQIKGRHRPQIAELSRQLISLDQAARPGRSLTEDEERQHIAQRSLPGAVEERTSLAEQLDNRLGAMRREVASYLQSANAGVQDEVAAFIEANGGTVTSRIVTTNALGAVIPSGFLHDLADHEKVNAVMRDAPKEYELNNSIPSVGYDTWHSDSIDGGIYDFGIPEGVQDDHPAFDTHTIVKRTGSTSSSHGTHVTGIVASDDATYRGGAYGLDKILWAETGSFQSGTMSDMEWMATQSDNPEAVNHSLGYGTATTDYATNDAFYDAYIRQYDLMVTKSCGNGAWSDGSTTMTYPATAYNLMAVANMNDNNTATRTDDVRDDDPIDGSSTGPTIGGRKKPDIAAPGTDILSANSLWASSSDFITKTGTSMAAPHVAAGILLMLDGGNANRMAQKAVLINTADAWDSQNTATTSDDGEVSGSHWDKSYGWGYLDMDEAHFNRTDYFVGSIVAKNNNATADDYKLYRGTMFANEKATLVWEKRTTGYNAGAPPTTQYDLTDIDLYLFDEADGSTEDNDADSNDNVHQVAADSTITAVIKVYAFSSSIDGATSESFALATEENFASVNPPSFGVTLAAPASVNAGANFTVTATVTNNGGAAAFGNGVTLTLPSGFSLVSGANPADLGRLAAGASDQASWTVKAASTSGSHSLSAENSSYSYLETYTGIGNTNVSVVALPGKATLVSPTGTITDSTPTYSWNAVSGATWYYLWVNDSTGNKIKQWYTATATGCSGGTGTCSITPSTTVATGSGQWWIQTWNDAGYGPWSDAMAFNLTSPPGKATLVSPTGTITDATPTYTWNAVSDATWYYLWVDDATGNKIKQWHTSTAAGCAGGSGTCSVTPTTHVVGASKWWIQTYNAAGYGPWSDPGNFTVNVLPTAATLLSPGGNIIDTTPTYSWNAVGTATQYYLWVNDSTGNKIKQWYTAAHAGCSGGTGTCSVTNATALASGAGQWWIQTWNPTGYGPWSSPLQFNLGSVYDENFDDGIAQDWVEDEDASWMELSNWYRATKSSPSAVQVMTAYYAAQQFTDGTFEVDIWAGGVQNYAQYIYPRSTADFDYGDGSGTGSAIGFGLDPDERFYGVFKYVNGTVSTVVGWTSSNHIQQSGYNRVRVTASGNTFNFYINGNLVETVTDSSLSSGYLRLGGWTGPAYVETHWFDNVRVDISSPRPEAEDTISQEQKLLNETTRQNGGNPSGADI